MRSLAAWPAVILAVVLVAAVLTSCTGPSATEASAEHEHGNVEHGEVQPAGHNADDVAFATNMIPHHEQAVELSALVPDRSGNPHLRTLATAIATAQGPEIDTMKGFLAQWNAGTEAADAGHAGHGMVMQGMVDDATMTRLGQLRGPEFENLWLESMISHHQGAIEMAKAEIANGESANAVALARTIVEVQQAEIGQMKQMLAAG